MASESRDTHLSDAEALEATARLRHDPECDVPGERGCFLYGRETILHREIDPRLPPGGWTLGTTPSIPEGPPRWGKRTPVEGEPRLTSRLWVHPPRDEDDLYDLEIQRIELRVGRRHVHAFDYFMGFGGDQYGTLPGVTAVGDELVAWIWVIDAAALFASRHDARTGARLGPPLAVSAHPLGPVECTSIFTDTRVVTVLDGEEMHAALLWSFPGDALLFDGPDARGRFVEMRGAESDHRPLVLDAPPVLRLSRCGEARCLTVP